MFDYHYALTRDLTLSSHYIHPTLMYTTINHESTLSVCWGGTRGNYRVLHVVIRQWNEEQKKNKQTKKNHLGRDYMSMQWYDGLEKCSLYNNEALVHGDLTKQSNDSSLPTTANEIKIYLADRLQTWNRTALSVNELAIKQLLLLIEYFGSCDEKMCRTMTCLV